MSYKRLTLLGGLRDIMNTTRRVIKVKALVFMLILVSGTAFAQDAFLGAWQGVIGPDVINLNIGIVFEDVEGEMQASITIPAQGFEGALSIDEITEDGIVMSIQVIPGDPSFDGTLIENSIRGSFTQAGQELAFSLERSSEAVTLQRLQDPVEPYPYKTEELSFTNGDISIAGTLSLPEGEGPFAAVVMITGSGPQDRNEALAGHRPFLVLADAMTKAGFAVLRTDDRGVGGTTGDLSQASYEDLAGDVMAAIAFLAEREDIDASKIGLFGHSEGGFIAPLVASQQDIAFLISMAGPSVSGAEVLNLQNRLILEQEGASEEEVQVQLSYLESLGDALSREAYTEAKALTEARVRESFANADPAELPSEAVQEQLLEMQVASVATPYFRNIFVFDPQPYLKELDMPVLAFYGDKDIQVDAVQNLEPLELALANNADATIRVFEGLNHLMQPANTGAISEYETIDVTIAPEVLELITSWLSERF